MKNYLKMKNVLIILGASLMGTALVTMFEYFFGVVEVFVFCTILVAIVGIIVVPAIQLRDYFINRKYKQNKK